MSKHPAFERWSTAEVCVWLRTSGLAELTDKFSAQSIQGSDLLRLEDASLQSQLGLTAQERSAVLTAVYSLSGRPASARRSPHAVPTLPPVKRGMTMPNVVGAAGEARRTSEPNVAAPTRGRLTQTMSISGGAVSPFGKLSAQELMVNGASYSGWIRKQGGSVRTWKRRYMVLKAGCVYYFKSELASSARGQFSLRDYVAKVATEQLKYPWCLKLVNRQKGKRTYFISSSSEAEMNTWLERIQEDIRLFHSDAPPPVVPRPSNTLPAHNRMAVRPSVPEPDFDDDDEDSDEEEVLSPLPNSKGAPKSPSTQPAVPPRAPIMEGGVDADYLELVEAGGMAQPPQANKEHFAPTSLANLQSVLPSSSNKPRKSYEITTLKVKPTDKIEQVEEDDDDEDYICPDKSDFDIEPDDIEREDAERLLKQAGRSGCFIIRPGSSTVSVLTVWTGERCRHYKVFYDQQQKFSLQKGQFFTSVAKLLEFYHKETLPKCDKCLTERFVITRR